MATENEESQLADETEKDVESAQTEPEANTDDKADNKEPKQDESETDKETSNDDDLSFWKKMSRKNERDAKNAAKKLEASEQENTSLRMKVARMELRERHPQFTDDLIDALCTETTPEGLNAWAEKYLKYNPDRTDGIQGSDSTEKEPSAPKHELTEGDKLAMRAADTINGGGTWAGAKGNESDGRKRAQEIIAAKRKQTGSDK